MFTHKEENGKLTLKITHECDSCEGTGLYVGMGERGGAAVVCWKCKGTGKQETTLTYKEFTERKNKPKVTRVFQNGCGYCITDKDVTAEDGKVIEFTEYGCTYKDWKNGAIPKPIESLQCPYQHTNQRMQNSGHKAHKLYKSTCDKNIALGGYIRECKMFGCKEKCWAKYYELVGENYNEVN